MKKNLKFDIKKLKKGTLDFQEFLIRNRNVKLEVLNGFNR